LRQNPPSRLKTKSTVGDDRLSLRAISLSVKPAFQSFHNAARSSGVNRLLDIQHLPDSIESKGVASTGLHHPGPDFRRRYWALMPAVLTTLPQVWNSRCMNCP